MTTSKFPMGTIPTAVDGAVKIREKNGIQKNSNFQKFVILLKKQDLYLQNLERFLEHSPRFKTAFYKQKQLPVTLLNNII